MRCDAPLGAMQLGCSRFSWLSIVSNFCPKLSPCWWHILAPLLGVSMLGLFAPSQLRLLMFDIFFLVFCRSKSTWEQPINHHCLSTLPSENEKALTHLFCLFLHHVGVLMGSCPHPIASPGGFIPLHGRQRALSLGPGTQRGNFAIYFANAPTWARSQPCLATMLCSALL